MLILPWYLTSNAADYVYPSLPDGVTVTTVGGVVRRVSIANVNDATIDFNWLVIDGNAAYLPVEVTNCSNVIVRRFIAHNSDNHVVLIEGSSYCTFESCLAFDAADGNYKAWQIYQSTNITLNDCAGFGTGRKIFECYSDSDDCAFNRCWGRWDNGTMAGNKYVFAPTYESYRAACADCIAVIGSLPSAAISGGNPWCWGPDSITTPPAAATLTRCLAINSFNDNHFLTVDGESNTAMTLTDCMKASLNQTRYIQKADLWALRDNWKNSPIASALATYANANPLADIERLLRERRANLIKYLEVSLLIPTASAGKPSLRLESTAKVGRGSVDDTSAEANVAYTNCSAALDGADGTVFDGKNDYMQVASGGEITTNGAGAGTSFSFLVKFRATRKPESGVMVIFGESDSGEAAAGLAYVGLDSNGYLYWYAAGGAATGSIFGDLADGEVHTALCWYDASTNRRRAYVDGNTGTLLSTVTTENVSTADTTAIGASLRSTGPTRHFDGTIYECGRFPSVVSGAAFAAYHNAGTWPAATCKGRWTLTAPRTVTPDMSVGLWRNYADAAGLVQITSTSQPTYLASYVNELPALQFVNDYLSRDSGILIGTIGHVFAIAKTLAESVEQVLYSQACSGASNQFLKLGVSSSNRIWYSFSNGAVGAVELVDAGDVLGTNWHLLEWWSTGSEIGMAVDGVECTITGTNVTGDWFGDVNGTNNAVLGAVVTTSVQNYFDGCVACLLGYEYALSAGLRARVRKLLKNKYGIA